MPEPVVCAIDTLRETVDREHLPRSARLQVVYPRSPSYRSKESPAKNPSIDSAWQDYQRGDVVSSYTEGTYPATAR